MAQSQTRSSRTKLWLWRAAIEITGIIFLFYSNLLMGEFLHSNGSGKTLAWALRDIITRKNFAIALFTAGLGFVIFEFFRKKLQETEDQQ